MLYNNLFYHGDEEAISYSDCEIDEYWNERGKVVISQKAEKDILETTFKMHNMMLEAVDKVLKDDVLLTLFNVNKNLWPAMKYSWKNN